LPYFARISSDFGQIGSPIADFGCRGNTSIRGTWNFIC